MAVTRSGRMFPRSVSTFIFPFAFLILTHPNTPSSSIPSLTITAMSATSNTNYESLFNFSSAPPLSPFDYSTPGDEHQSLDGDQLGPSARASSLEGTPSTGTRHRSDSVEGGDSPAVGEPHSGHCDKRVRSEMDVMQFVQVAMTGRSLQPSSTADLHAFAKVSYPVLRSLVLERIWLCRLHPKSAKSISTPSAFKFATSWTSLPVQWFPTIKYQMTLQ